MDCMDTYLKTNNETILHDQLQSALEVKVVCHPVIIHGVVDIFVKVYV